MDTSCSRCDVTHKLSNHKCFIYQHVQAGMSVVGAHVSAVRPSRLWQVLLAQDSCWQDQE